MNSEIKDFLISFGIGILTGMLILLMFTLLSCSSAPLHDSCDDFDLSTKEGRLDQAYCKIQKHREQMEHGPRH